VAKRRNGMKTKLGSFASFTSRNHPGFEARSRRDNNQKQGKHTAKPKNSTAIWGRGAVPGREKKNRAVAEVAQKSAGGNSANPPPNPKTVTARVTRPLERG